MALTGLINNCAASKAAEIPAFARISQAGSAEAKTVIPERSVVTS